MPTDDIGVERIRAADLQPERDCIACYTPTRTKLALDGSAEWFAYGCQRLGIPIREAEAMLHLMAQEQAPYGGGRFGQGHERIPDDGVFVIAVCPTCAAKAQLQVGETATIPTYKEPSPDA